jgi:hypothetical protein
MTEKDAELIKLIEEIGLLEHDKRKLEKESVYWYSRTFHVARLNPEYAEFSRKHKFYKEQAENLEPKINELMGRAQTIAQHIERERYTERDFM